MNVLHKLDSNTRKNIEKSFFVLDIETNELRANKENFLFGVLYGFEYEFIFFKIEDFFKEISKKQFRNKTIFAHNAEFDFTIIFGNLLKNLDDCIYNGKFIFGKYGNITLADSLNIFPTSVKKLGDELGIKKLEIDIDELSKNIISKKMITYCKRDCEIVYESLLKIFKLVGNLKVTIASLSMLYFRKKFLNENIYFDKEFSDLFFNSYYGGRVECLKLGKTKSFKFDINSMYPFAMREAIFPNPAKLRKGNVNKFNYYLKNYEGMAEIEVEHKKINIGYLPYKYNDKLIFPVGNFMGTWNFNEIRHALECGVIKIKKVISVIYGERMSSPFVEYVNVNYKLRNENKGNIYNMIYKLMLNSLYGKFAQRDRPNEKYYENIPTDILDYYEKNNIKYMIKMFSLEREDCYIITESDFIQLSEFSIPVFSSYITSYSRVLLLKYLKRFEKNKITYMDTDSICCEIPIKENSLELGKLKLENEIITDIMGNKNYTEIRDGIKHTKIKGIPKNAEKIGELFVYNKLIKSREAIRRNLISGDILKVSKRLKNKYDKRILTDSGFTKPICL